MTVRVLPTKWGPVALVCKKCGKKLGGGFGRKGRHGLTEALQDRLKESGRRRAVRVVETGCLGVCPKGAVAVALGDRVLVVDEGTEAEAVIEAIGQAGGRGPSVPRREPGLPPAGDLPPG